MLGSLLLTTKFWIVFAIICLFLSCIAYLYYEGMPFKYIYKRKTVYIEPWKILLPPAFIYWAYLTISGSVLAVFYFMYIKKWPLSKTLILIIFYVVFCSIVQIFGALCARNTWIKIRISWEKLIIHYYDLRKSDRMKRYFKLKINTKNIKSIERVSFPNFYDNFDKNYINRQLDETYSYVIRCNMSQPEKTADGIDITLSNGKHIVFETDDAVNCINVLRRVTGPYNIARCQTM